MASINHSQAADFYSYVERLEKENRKLKNEVNHLRAQVQRLNPPKKKPSNYEIKFNPVTNSYVQAHTIIKLDDEEDNGNYPSHDNKHIAYLYDALLAKSVTKLTKLLDGAVGDELLQPDTKNFDRNLFHCLGIVFQHTTEVHIEQCVVYTHHKIKHLEGQEYFRRWVEILFQVDAQGYIPLHFLLYFTSRSLFNGNFLALMKALQKYQVIRTETFLMACGVELRLTPQRSFYYRNKYIEDWEIKEIPYYNFIINYRDLYEWIDSGDELRDYPAHNVFKNDFAFVGSVLLDFSTEPDKSEYLVACNNGETETILRLQHANVSPGVAMEGIYIVCKNGHLNVLKTWVQQSQDDELDSSFFLRGFHGAVENGQFPVVKYLMTEIELHPNNDDVILAVHQGHLEMLVYFADQSAQTRSTFCLSPLKYIAAHPEYNNFARRLVNLDWFLIEGRFEEGDLFSTAFQYDNFELIDIILDSRDSSEFTPLASYAIMLYAKRANLPRIEAIVGHSKFSKKSYVWDSIITEEYETAIFFAARHGDAELVRFLVTELSSHFDLPDSNLQAKNILHFAAEGGSMPVIRYIKNVLAPRQFNKLLCARSIDFSDPEHATKYPFEFAKANYHINVADYLLRLMDGISQAESNLPLSERLIPPDFVAQEQVIQD